MLNLEDGSIWLILGVIIFILLIALNGIFYGFAAALQNLSEPDLEKKAQEKDAKAIKLQKLLAHPMQYIYASPILVLASGISFGYFFVPLISGEIYKERTGVFPIVIIILAVIVFASLDILTFRRVGTYRSESFAYRYVNIVYAISEILYPITYFVGMAAKFAAVPFGVEMSKNGDDITEQEIISIVDEAHEQGIIEENEAEMIQNIITFNETEAGDIMTHRMNVIAFDEEVLLQEMVDTMLEEGNSRYPVYRENIDNIIGIINYKDALKFRTRNSWAKFKPLKELPGLIRQADFIPETRGIGDLFHTMQAKKLHMAVVVDEYGQTAGIVSMEDILEEIVGEILDEYDEDEQTIKKQVDNSIVIDALADLEDVEEQLGIEFGDCEFETLNGYLTSILGHIPSKKDLDQVIQAEGYSFRILSLGNKTIGKVKAEKLPGTLNS